MKAKKGQMALRNPVARHAAKFNKAATHRDKKHDYQRHEKHKGRARREDGYPALVLLMPAEPLLSQA